MEREQNSTFWSIAQRSMYGDSGAESLEIQRASAGPVPATGACRKDPDNEELLLASFFVLGCTATPESDTSFVLDEQCQETATGFVCATDLLHGAGQPAAGNVTVKYARVTVTRQGNPNQVVQVVYNGKKTAVPAGANQEVKVPLNVVVPAGGNAIIDLSLAGDFTPVAATARLGIDGNGDVFFGVAVIVQ